MVIAVWKGWGLGRTADRTREHIHSINIYMYPGIGDILVNQVERILSSH